MKKQFKELQEQVIQLIIDGNYTVKHAEFSGSYFNIKIEIEDIIFNFSIPSHKKYVIGYSNRIEVFDNLEGSEIAELLYNRHAKEITKEQIQRQIDELQKQLA